MQDELTVFLDKYFNHLQYNIHLLPQSGSARSNYVVTSNDHNYILTKNENVRENHAFLYWTQVFSKENISVPKIFDVDESQQVYLQEYLGDQTLSEVISQEGESDRTKKLVQSCLNELFNLQNRTLGKVDFSKTFEYEAYDELPIIHDLYYFKNFLIDILELPYHKSSLLKEFNYITKTIKALKPQVVMIRDFQSRNIMVGRNDRIAFIDYQSAMQGPAMYDVISFLYQAKANFSKDFKEEMTNYYIGLWKETDIIIELKKSIPYLKMIRFLQVLGAYGFRGLIQRKSHFIESLEQGIKNLKEFNQQEKIMNNYPELSKLIEVLGYHETKNKINKIIDGK